MREIHHSTPKVKFGGDRTVLDLRSIWAEHGGAEPNRYDAMPMAKLAAAVSEMAIFAVATMVSATKALVTYED